MTQEQFTTIILQPSEGNFLTQAGDIDILERVVAGRVALGAGDSPENWREISAEEAEEYERLRREAVDALRQTPEDTAREETTPEESQDSEILEEPV